MRFLVAASPELTDRGRPPVRWFLVFALVLLAALVVQRAVGAGLTGPAVEAHYLGAGGLEPLASVALWEEVHGNAFVYGFLLFVLASIQAVAALSPRARRLLLVGGGAAALADLLAPFLVMALHGLGWLRVATFAATIALLGAGAVAGLLRFGKAAPAARPVPRDDR